MNKLPLDSSYGVGMIGSEVGNVKGLVAFKSQASRIRGSR